MSLIALFSYYFNKIFNNPLFEYQSSKDIRGFSIG